MEISTDLATPETDGSLVSGGWMPAAIAVHSILLISTPMFLRLGVPGHDPILIDFRHHAFAWPASLHDFPSAVPGVSVETEPTDPDAAPLFALPGHNLDGLLWLIGLTAFRGAPASWLRPGERYRLSRWPNLTELGCTPDQLRMVALLGQRFLSAEELAGATGMGVTEAQSIVNALSLMGIVTAAADAPAAPAAAPPQRGLFRRLRDRLGL